MCSKKNRVKNGEIQNIWWPELEPSFHFILATFPLCLISIRWDSEQKQKMKTLMLCFCVTVQLEQTHTNSTYSTPQQSTITYTTKFRKKGGEEKKGIDVLKNS